MSVDLAAILLRVQGPQESIVARARGPRGAVELHADNQLVFDPPLRGMVDVVLKEVDLRRVRDARWIGLQVQGRGKKGRGRLNAFGWIEADPKALGSEINPAYPECELDWFGLADTVGCPRLNLWRVGATWLPPKMRGYGLGRLLYERLLVLAAHHRAALVPDICGEAGSTSIPAMRVWKRLVEEHASQGWVVVRADLLPAAK